MISPHPDSCEALLYPPFPMGATALRSLYDRNGDMLAGWRKRKDEYIVNYVMLGRWGQDHRAPALRDWMMRLTYSPVGNAPDERLPDPREVFPVDEGVRPYLPPNELWERVETLRRLRLDAINHQFDPNKLAWEAEVAVLNLFALSAELCARLLQAMSVPNGSNVSAAMTNESPPTTPSDMSSEISVPERQQAFREKLFPRGIPEDQDLVDCIILLDSKRDGETPDFLSRLRTRSIFSDGSAAAFLADVAQSGPLPSNAKAYAERIEWLHHKRCLAQIAADAARHFQNGADPREEYANLRAELDAYGGNFGTEELTAEKLLDETFDAIARRDAAESIAFGPWTCNLSRLPLRRTSVITVGGQAGSGKTAAMCQGLFDAMRMPRQENLTFLCLNVEMPPAMLIERQLGRIAGVDATALQRRTFAERELPQLEAAREELRPVLRRTRFATAPFTVARLVMQVQEFDPDLVLVDYLQRIGGDGDKVDLRAQINSTMDALRQVASDGRAVVAISALNRPSGGGDWSKETVSLASFRESSEVEYSSDAVYALVRDRGSRAATLVALKNRSGPLEDIELEFEGAYQRFVNAPVADFPEFRD